MGYLVFPKVDPATMVTTGVNTNIDSICANLLKNIKDKLSKRPTVFKNDEINKAFQEWLMKRAEIIFNERLNECIKAFPDIAKPTLKIRKLNKRWGSYLKKHEIVLNPALIKASKQSIDYVIYHELSHFKYMNHQKEFHQFLQKYVPNELECKKELKKFDVEYE